MLPIIGETLGKKILLRDRKRHTAGSVAYPVLVGGWGGGDGVAVTLHRTGVPHNKDRFGVHPTQDRGTPQQGQIWGTKDQWVPPGKDFGPEIMGRNLEPETMGYPALLPCEQTHTCKNSLPSYFVRRR